MASLIKVLIHEELDPAVGVPQKGLGRDTGRSLEICVNGCTVPLPIPPGVRPSLSQLWLQDLLWYLEDYVIHEPFAAEKASFVEGKLLEHGKDLAQSICSAIGEHVELLNCSIVVMVLDLGPQTPLAAEMYWEFIENSLLWPENSRPSNITLVRRVPRPALRSTPMNYFDSGALLHLWPRHEMERRKSFQNGKIRIPIAKQVYGFSKCTKSASLTPELDLSTDASRLSRDRRVLVLTARPRMARDIPYRLVTMSIHRTIRRLQQSRPSVPNLEICRPGTFQALRRALESRPFQHFDVVHLDVHGWSRSSQAYLDFIKLDEGLVSADPIAATELAALLVENGVLEVVLNACQSASTQADTSNLALQLISAGVENVVGMGFKITDTAAQLFVEALYQGYLSDRVSLAQAAASARARMRLSPAKTTVYGTEIALQDYLVPVTYTSNNDPDLTNVSGATNIEVEAEHDHTLFDRENVMLQLETDIAAGCRLIGLQGPAGQGKTALLYSAISWWQDTSFVRAMGYQTYLGVDEGGLERMLQYQDDLHQEPDAQVDDKKIKLLVLDSLESMRFTETADHASSCAAFGRLLKRLLRQLDNVCVLLLSRSELGWLKSSEDSVHVLDGLSKDSRIQLAMRVMRDLDREIDLQDAENRLFLNLCLDLTQGNPLAIELLMKTFSTGSLTPKEFYSLLLGSSRVDVDLNWCDHHEGARYIGQIKSAFQWLDGMEELERVAQILFLSYFWNWVPSDLIPYSYFLLQANVAYDVMKMPSDYGFVPAQMPVWTFQKMYEIMLSLQSEIEIRLLSFNHTKGRDQSWFETEFPGQERVVLDRNFPEIKTDESGFGLDWEAKKQWWQDFFARMQAGGFLQGKHIVDYTAEGGSREESYSWVHPVLTFVLRGLSNDLSKRGKMVADMAYLRYHEYRFACMPWSEYNIARAYQGVVQQLDLEFSNLITAANINLQLDLRLRNNAGLLQGYSLVHWQSLDRNKLSSYFEWLQRCLNAIEGALNPRSTPRLQDVAFYCLTCLPGIGTQMKAMKQNAELGASVMLQIGARGALKRATEMAYTLQIPQDHPLWRQMEKIYKQLGDNLEGIQLPRLEGVEISAVQAEKTQQSLNQFNTVVSGMSKKLSARDRGKEPFPMEDRIVADCSLEVMLGATDSGKQFGHYIKAIKLARDADTDEQHVQAEYALQESLIHFSDPSQFWTERATIYAYMTRSANRRQDFRQAAENLSEYRRSVARAGITTKSVRWEAEQQSIFRYLEGPITLNEEFERIVGSSNTPSDSEWDLFRRLVEQQLENGNIGRTFSQATLMKAAYHGRRFDQARAHLEEYLESAREYEEAKDIEGASAIALASKEWIDLTVELLETLRKIDSMDMVEKVLAIEGLHNFGETCSAFLEETDCPSQVSAAKADVGQLMIWLSLGLLDLDSMRHYLRLTTSHLKAAKYFKSPAVAEAMSIIEVLIGGLPRWLDDIPEHPEVRAVVKAKALHVVCHLCWKEPCDLQLVDAFKAGKEAESNQKESRR